MNRTAIEDTDNEFSLLAEAAWLATDDSHAQVVDLQYGLAILADCSAGGSTGELASHIATSVIYACMQQGMQDFDWSAAGDASVDSATGDATARIRAMLHDAIARAQSRIARLTGHGPHAEGLDTAMMTALFHADRALVARAGGALLFRMRDGRLHALTRNGASLQQRNAEMLLLPARDPASRHGMFAAPHEHRAHAHGAHAHGVHALSSGVMLESYTTLPGDLYLLCSADVPRMLSVEEIEALLCAYFDHPETAYAALLARVGDHDAQHTGTLILVKLEPAPTQMAGFFGRILSHDA